MTEELTERIARELEHIRQLMEEEAERKRKKGYRKLSLGASHTAIGRGFEGAKDPNA